MVEDAGPIAATQMNLGRGRDPSTVYAGVAWQYNVTQNIFVEAKLFRRQPPDLNNYSAEMAPTAAIWLATRVREYRGPG